jgi:hypothetical protein
MIYINTNAEIIADQVDAHLLPEPAARAAVAEMYLEGYTEAIGPVACETVGSFREWRGGSMSLRQRLGDLTAWDDVTEREAATKICAALETLIARLTQAEIRSRAEANKYIVDGWITIKMSAEQAARWNAGEMSDDEVSALPAYTTESSGPQKTVADLLAIGEVSEDDLRNPAEAR